MSAVSWTVWSNGFWWGWGAALAFCVALKALVYWRAMRGKGVSDGPG